MRKILSMDGNVINRVDACFKLVSDLGESSPIGFIAKSSVTTSKFIEVASKWSNYNDLHMLSRIIGPNAYSHRIMAEIYQGRHKQIADALLTQEDVNAEWITVAKILISLDELSTLKQVIDRMPYCVVKKMLRLDHVPATIREMVIQRYLFEEHSLTLEVKDVYIGPHPTISHYYPKYKDGILYTYNGSYSSGSHDHCMESKIILHLDKSILEINFGADKWSRGYRYNTKRRIKFIFNVNEKMLYKETKRGLSKVS